MAVTQGISGIPFEHRYRQPDPKRRKRERMTKTERLVCAICGSLLGLFIWTFASVILASAAMKAVARRPITTSTTASAPVDTTAMLPPYWWGGVLAFSFAGYGTIVGAERMLDRFEQVIQLEGKIARAVDRS